MMETSDDPYELKLYQIFQSCESKAHCGLLDEDALRRLCALLELRDNELLIANLAANQDFKMGVSFEQFKEALLSFLGSEYDVSASGSLTANTAAKEINKERSLVLTDEAETTYYESPNDSIDRVGIETVGHSQMKSQQDNVSLQLTYDTDDDSEAENVHNDKRSISLGLNGHRVKRCASHTDLPEARNNRTQYMPAARLKRCSSLPARQTQPVNLKPGHIMSAAISKATTKSSWTAQAFTKYRDDAGASSAESLDEEPASLGVEVLKANAVLDIWDDANIPNGREILSMLGFKGDHINILQLIKFLQEEAHEVTTDSRANMQRALIALQTRELTTLRRSYHQLHDENAKLRLDNKDANRRIALLAAEMDERHAALEEGSKKELKLLEQRYNTQIRDLSARSNADREHWVNMVTRLEAKIKNFEENEIKFKTEMELIRKENAELETEYHKEQKQVAELLQRNIQLNDELINYHNCRMLDDERIVKEEQSNEELLGLMDEISALQKENAQLRDKNDELVVQLEHYRNELAKTKQKSRKSSEVESTLEGDNDKSDASLASELQNTPKMQLDEISALKSRITELETELCNIKTQENDSELLREAEERCKELEDSLEKMQRAYDDCEDYWDRKMTEERQIFEDYQAESNKNLEELFNKVSEYEAQFNKEGLSTINEYEVLEDQYLALESELTQERITAQDELDMKAKEIEMLQKEIADLRLQLGESVEILTGAREIPVESLSTDIMAQSPAYSPMGYLLNQSTLQEPVKDLKPLEDIQNTTVSIIESHAVPNHEANRW